MPRTNLSQSEALMDVRSEKKGRDSDNPPQKKETDQNSKCTLAKLTFWNPKWKFGSDDVPVRLGGF